MEMFRSRSYNDLLQSENSFLTVLVNFNLFCLFSFAVHVAFQGATTFCSSLAYPSTLSDGPTGIFIICKELLIFLFSAFMCVEHVCAQKFSVNVSNSIAGPL